MSSTMRFEHRMSDSDALMWGIEKDPMLRSTITAVAILDQAPVREQLRDRLERGSRLIPRLRQRVQSAPLSPAPPRWVVDPHFDMGYHLRFVQAPGAGSLRDLLNVAQPIAMQGFDRARPLWEFTVVEGLADGRAALIQKVHHAVTDGVGGIKLAMMLVDLEREPATDLGPMPPAPEPDAPGWFDRVVDATQHERRRALGIAKRQLGSAGRLVTDPGGTVGQAATNLASISRLLAPAFEPLSPVMRDRSLSVHFETLTFPVDELKAAARRVEGKLNDAFVAGVAGGFRRYHEHHGHRVEALRMSMPISIRSADTADLAGNQFVPARFPVPVGIEDPAERMRAIRALVTTQRNEPSLGFVEGISGVLNRLPTAITTEVFGRLLKGIDFVTSNVPGVPVPIYFAGGRLEAQFAFGPLAGSATNLTLLSYLDECHIGVNTDPAAIPDPDVFLDCVQQGFDEVRKVSA